MIVGTVKAMLRTAAQETRQLPAPTAEAPPTTAVSSTMSVTCAMESSQEIRKATRTREPWGAVLHRLRSGITPCTMEEALRGR